MIGDDEMRAGEEIERGISDVRAAKLESRIDDYEAFAHTDEGSMLEVFDELRNREGFVEEYCKLQREGLPHTAAGLLNNCLKEEVREFAERNVQEHD